MRTFRLPKKLAVACMVVGGVMVASPLTAAFAQTGGDAASEVGAFDAIGDSNGIGAVFGNPNAPPYPTATLLVPYAGSSLTAGPSGRALSSMNWPGPLAGNAGSLVNVIGAAPLPPNIVANANYPVKAEANAGGGGRDEQTVGPMRAIVDGAEAQAITTMSDFATPALVSASRIVTESRSFLENGLAIVEAETVMEDVEVANLLGFESIRTFVRAESDGVTAKVAHDVTVTGATVGGQPAEITDEGLVVNGAANENPAVGAVTGANQALQQMGMEAFLTDPYVQETGPGAAQASSGALVIFWQMNEAGQHTILTLGGSTAQVAATTGGFGGLDDVVGGDSFTPIAGDSFSPSTGSFDSGVGSVPVADIPTGSGGSAGSPQSFTPIQPLELTTNATDRLPIGWMLIGMGGMLLLGMGLNGLRAAAIAASGGFTCPLERSA